MDSHFHIFKNNINIIKKFVLIFIFSVIGFIHAQQSIVIAPYVLENGEKIQDNISKHIPNKIQTRLVKENVINVLERKKLEVLLEEKKLTETGLVDSKTAVEAGKLIGADLVLLGNLDFLNKKRFNVSSRLVDVEKGKVLKQWTATDIHEKKVEKYIDTVADDIIQMVRQKIALNNIVSLINPHQNFKVQVKSNSDSLRFGEMLALTVIPEVNAYLYVFDVGTSGDIHLLFPNRIQTDNYVAHNDSIVIGNLRAGAPEGIEIIKVIATQDSISLQEMMDIAGSTATFHSYDEDAAAFSRDLELIVSPLAEDRWSSSTLRLHILEQ